MYSWENGDYYIKGKNKVRIDPSVETANLPACLDGDPPSLPVCQ
jgi:hypothetical protein